MKIKSLLICACVGAAAVFSSCNKDSDYDFDQNYVNFVTLDSFSDAGASMSFRQKGDSPLITLTTNQKFPSKIFTVGTRIVISYIPSNGLQYVSGPVSIIEAMPTEGLGKPAEAKTAEETGDWATEAVNMKDMNVSGEYLDMIFVANTSKNGQTIELVLDKATENDEVPQYHLMFKPKTDSDMNNYYLYCSYSIGDSWVNPLTKGIRVHYQDVVGGAKYIDFMK